MDLPRDSSDIQIAFACQTCNGNDGFGSRSGDGGNPHNSCTTCNGTGWTLKRPAELTAMQLARLVQRLPKLQGAPGSESPGSIIGTIVEAGDDETGQPRITIHTTEEELKRIELIRFYKSSRITFTPLP